MSETAMPAALDDPNRVGHHGAEATGYGAGGPAPKRVVTAYGFWLFLLSDFVVFSAFFATYAVLAKATAGGPQARQLFNLTNVGVETACLLASSFACGMASIAASVRSQLWTQICLLVTGLLGFAFVALEVSEFARMNAEGAGPARSAFLSAFFSLVGLHGLHVSVGLLWLGTMMAQILAKGFRPTMMRRLLCFTLFWHALDIIWVALFTTVYLMGAG
jgi:cytochrome o ubiquinol oxidase subunit III